MDGIARAASLASLARGHQFDPLLVLSSRSILEVESIHRT